MESSKDHPLDRLLNLPEKAARSIDLIVPDEGTLIHLYNSKFFERVARVARRKKKSKPLGVRVACVFNRRIQIIRQYSPFIKFISLWPGAFHSKRLVVIVDGTLVIIFGGSERGEIEEQSDGVEMLGRSVANYDSQKYPSLVSCWVDLFQGLMDRRMRYEELDEESNYSNLLLDLLTHDMGNYHQTILLGIEDALETLSRKSNNPEIDGYAEARRSLEISREVLERGSQFVKNVKMLESLRRRPRTSLRSVDLIGTIAKAALSVNNPDDAPKSDYGPTPRRPHKRIELGFLPESTHSLESAKRPFVLADELLTQLFVNLFSNSLKNCDSQKARVDVSIERQVISSSDYWEVEVCDYGRGMVDELKDELSDALTRGLSHRTGLGLWIVKALMKVYEGKVWAEDRVFRDPSRGVRIGLLFKAARCKTPEVIAKDPSAQFIVRRSDQTAAVPGMSPESKA